MRAILPVIRLVSAGHHATVHRQNGSSDPRISSKDTDNARVGGDFLSCALELCLIPSTENYRCSVSNQTLSRFLANSRTAAGNDRYFSFEVHRNLSFRCEAL